MEYVYGDCLVHHGIKGQKWGVRRYQNPDGSLTAAGKKRQYGRKVYKAIAKNPEKIDQFAKDLTENNRMRAAFYNLENQIYGKRAQEYLNEYSPDLNFREMQNVGSDAVYYSIERAKSEYDASPAGQKDKRVQAYDNAARLLDNVDRYLDSEIRDFMSSHKLDDRIWSKDYASVMKEIRERSKGMDGGEYARILNMTPQELLQYSLEQSKKG